MESSLASITGALSLFIYRRLLPYYFLLTYFALSFSFSCCLSSLHFNFSFFFFLFYFPHSILFSFAPHFQKHPCRAQPQRGMLSFTFGINLFKKSSFLEGTGILPQDYAYIDLFVCSLIFTTRITKLHESSFWNCAQYMCVATERIFVE